MATALPEYVRATAPTPPGRREPWHKNTAPSYAGIYLWVAFYLQLASGTISQMGVGLAILALVVAGLLCFGLYYYAPAMLGMQTGRPLYVVGTSTFGTLGGYVMPGLLMGVLQLGWFAVATHVSTEFIMKGLHQTSGVLFTVIALCWAYGLAFVAMNGISHVARAARFLNWVPLVMIVIVALATVGGVSSFQPAARHPARGFATVLEIVIGFSAAAGAEPHRVLRARGRFVRAICGAMTADYVLAGRRWSGPRAGINWAGYVAWALGFVVGILDRIPAVPPALVAANHPAGLNAFVVAFVAYWALAKAGLRPALVPQDRLAAPLSQAAVRAAELRPLRAP